MHPQHPAQHGSLAARHQQTHTRSHTRSVNQSESKFHHKNGFNNMKQATRGPLGSTKQTRQHIVRSWPSAAQYMMAQVDDTDFQRQLTAAILGPARSEIGRAHTFPVIVFIRLVGGRCFGGVHGPLGKATFLGSRISGHFFRGLCGGTLLVQHKKHLVTRVGCTSPCARRFLKILV